jgi:hypothetical protein
MLEPNRHVSSLIDISSSPTENISRLIVDINTRIIYINLFNERYPLRIKEFNNIGPLRRTISLWLDIEPQSFKFEFKGNVFENENNLFDLRI